MFSRYLDPKNDLAFKKVFGQEKHKRIPIAFLNAIFNFSGKDEIIDLEFLDPKQPPEIEARKESIVDLLVRDKQGSKYIIEMQVAKIAGFEKRAQYYAAKTYCTHFNAGDPYYNLKKVVFLAITDYLQFPQKQAYKSNHSIIDLQTSENDLKDFHFTFVELPKFTKTLEEITTLEEKWYYFLKHAEESNTINEIFESNPEIKEAYSVLERIRWSEQDLQWYDRTAMATADARGRIEQGREEGRKEGKEEGRKEGREEGREEEKREIARNLLLQGISIEIICKTTGLSKKEIES